MEQQSIFRTRAARHALAAAVVVLACVGAAVWWLRGPAADDDVSYRTGEVEKGPLEAAVSSSGMVMPVTQVSVGSQISGQIQDLYVDFNDEVKAGQLIARLDPQLYEYQVRQAQADLDAARSQVLIAQANVVASRAAVSRAEVDLAEARRDDARKSDLVSRQFIAQSESDKARALVNTSIEALKSAQAQLGVTLAQVESAAATVQQREAALAQARINLERTRITSPVSGIVIKRAVERGQTVAASLQAPELFIIARNLSDMRVETSVDEADVGRIQAGQKATFTVDAFSGQTWQGQVTQVRKAAVALNNVVTYVVVVGFSNADHRLLPGMTANVRVVTESRPEALKVPNAALRVRMPEPDGKATPSAPRSVRAGRLSRVHVLDAQGRPRAVPVQPGLSDGTFTEVSVPPETPDAGLLVPGARVVTAVQSAKPAAAGLKLPF